VHRFAELADGLPPDVHDSSRFGAVDTIDSATTAKAVFEVSRRTRVVKRALDLLVAVPLAVLSLPVLVVLALAIRVSSRGPVFFRQARIGRDGSPFTMWKLRSMYLDAEERLRVDHSLRDLHRLSGFKLPPGVDPRVTRLGKFLRKSSLDELPQLWQVVSGKMSLVGPRPVVEAELESLYGPMSEYYLALRPGVTGLWQVTGRSDVTHQDRCALDVEYASSVSLRRDFSILVRTVPAVARAHGAH
jgi:lipopolysaccharide/colanic/teichoic acid biosynthesis glycosyltransferase